MFMIQGSSWNSRFELCVQMVLGMLIFCGLATFLTFWFIYYKKVQRLEVITIIIWGLASLSLLAGILASGLF